MRVFLSTLSAAAALVACAPRENAAVQFVKALYEPYLAGAPAQDAFRQDVFTPDMNALLDKARTYSALLETPVVDADPFMWAQDGTVEDLRVSLLGSPGDDAQSVSVTFVNLGRTTILRFTLRQLDGQWRVDNISDGKENLRAIIASALAPAGDATAMEAPVRSVYERYGVPGKYTPLQRLAALSPALRARLEQAAKAPSPVPDFDPAVDAKRPAVGPVSYEPAGSSVIVRFDNNGSPKLLVYDLVESDGVWLIADIRAPGQWSLVQKLADAGYPDAQ